VNDTLADVACAVTATLYDGKLARVWTKKYKVKIPTDASVMVDESDLDTSQADDKPLFLHLSLATGAGVVDENWYFFDFVSNQGSLFNRPKTTLDASLRRVKDGFEVKVTNTGSLPAISVELDLGTGCFAYYADRNGLWLAPGESKTIRIARTPTVDGSDYDMRRITASAWNAGPVELEP